MILTIFIPLFNFLGLLIVGRLLGKMGTLYWVAVHAFLSVCCNIYLFICINTLSTAYYFSFGSWFTVGMLDIRWEFVIDSLSMIMLLMVSVISSLVQFYSVDYMKHDPHFIRFLSFLSLFTFFMYILVTATNFVQLFLGWEGVGICSYILINFWTTRIQASKAAIKAVLMNRMGDIGYLFGASVLYNFFFTLDFNVLYPILGLNAAYFFDRDWAGTDFFNPIDVGCLFFLIGVIAKSAQIGLHTWLPAAMEGPTPVSALIHAATMVTAGIFLVIRTSFLFDYSPVTCQVAICFGAVTAFASALTAIFLYDIKKIIAYSTCSQLGYMLVAAGLSQYNISLFHLINHAFFKALLFLTAGAIIHSFMDEQDIRKLGLLYQRAPLLFSSVFIGNISIMGLPFLAGFYSKDLILESAFLKLSGLFSSDISVLIFLILCGATMLTALYSCRLVYYIVFKTRQYTIYDSLVGHINQPVFIRLVLVVLSGFSIFSGYLFSDFFASTNLAVLPSVYWTLWSNSFVIEFEFLSAWQKIMPIFLNTVIVCFFILILWFVKYHQIYFDHRVSFLANVLFTKRPVLEVSQYFFVLYYYMRYSTFFLNLSALLSYNFYFNEVYNYFITFYFYAYYTTVVVNFDKGLLEVIGPFGVSAFYQGIIHFISRIYKSDFKIYLFTLYTVVVAYFILFVMYC